MVVEDDRPIAEILERILTDTGYRCLRASQGAEALEVLQQHGPADVIILDWMMPVMSGEEFLYTYRKTDTKTPVIVISALDLRKVKLPVSAVIHKPFELSHLLQVVERSMECE